MKCPKCHKTISDNLTVCPYCHKVLALECPNCHSLGESPVCEKCGYIILTKCSKCGKTVSTSAQKCKCGFPVKTSVAYQECETDEFASLIIQFSSLKNIRRLLGSQELFTKFFFRLRNLLMAQFKGIDGKIINYNDTFIINMNKELSFPTSANKAIRLAIKIINAFSELNANVIEELSTPLKLNITIIKKSSEELLDKTIVDTNVKLLSVKKNEKRYLKGMQIILDQYVCDCISKDYKTDSLYSVEQNGTPLMFYEILLDSYVLPPSEKNTDVQLEVHEKEITKPANEPSDDIYSFKVFDINAKCKFEKVNAVSLLDKLQNNKIISIRSEKDLEIRTGDLVNYLESKGLKPVRAICSEELNYKPWGVFEQLFKDYYGLSFHKALIPPDFDVKRFKAIIDLINSKPRKASTPEDARFAYMEDFGAFLSSLKNCAVIIEGFEYMDDTSIQTLELYFDRFKNINVQFVFITDSETSLHSKVKGLLRTPLYTEYTLQKSNMDSILTTVKEEASDFIQSFFFEKIKENYNGSLLYFDNALKYLIEKNILINFDGRLIIKNNGSVILPNSLAGLLKARLKELSKDMDASMILAYSTYLGGRLDFEVITKLGIKNTEKAVQTLINTGFAYSENNVLYINNYNLVKPVIQASLKKNVNEFLAKNILANIGKGLDDTTTLLIMGKLSLFKEEYLLLWRNSQFAMAAGDYDSYLKNCLGFLSLIEHIENNIPEEDIENNKKEVYQNILMSLYNYSPEKIYAIENVLLIDAMNENNDEKIVKLSNLMLQGALIASNYTDALTLLHNILTRMPNPTLVVDGNINTKFLLLSLVNIEILFNIGDFAQCVDVAKDLLGILQPTVIEKIKPASFSTNLFIGHMLETFRLAAFAKLFLIDEGLDDLFQAIKASLNTELPDKDCILAIRDFLNGQRFSPSNIESSTAFAKVIYLILQEFEQHSDDYKTFAQNIYQAKLLAADLHQIQLEMFCDLLIAYSYANIGITKKAEIIYNDILEKAENSAIFNILTLARYFIAKLQISESKQDEALLIINDTLALLQKYNNQSKIIYILFEKLFIDLVKNEEFSSIDIESEEQKLALITSNGCLSRLTN